MVMAYGYGFEYGSMAAYNTLKIIPLLKRKERKGKEKWKSCARYLARAPLTFFFPLCQPALASPL